MDGPDCRHGSCSVYERNATHNTEQAWPERLNVHECTRIHAACGARRRARPWLCDLQANVNAACSMPGAASERYEGPGHTVAGRLMPAPARRPPIDAAGAGQPLRLRVPPSRRPGR